MLALLRLQQLADSAFPIGSAAHSFGIEALVDAGLLNVEGLARFLEDYLDESGVLEAGYCVASCELASSSEPNPEIIRRWLEWNAALGARKLARESRDASAAMGRRFLRLAAGVSAEPLLARASECASAAEAEVHLAACFGLVAGAFGIDRALAAAAFLQQSITTLISACQRLLPLGQTQAHEILWNLKPAILRTAGRARTTPPDEISCFTPLLDVASARHGTMYTRLFMS